MKEVSKKGWVHLGDYIEQCDERAGDKYTVDDVVGISIEKKFMPTKADMKDVSLSPYKLFKPKEFCYVTVTSRNGGKISLAINNSDTTRIVSSSYIVFRCIDTNELLPEYLFMLLNRSEFDRYSRFNSWGSARETFDWDEFCRVEIPLPSIEVQRELVAAYNGLKALAEQNEALLPQLSAACHAYIVDCRDKYLSVPLGDYIEQSDVRAGNNYTIDNLVGISTDKTFITSKANMSGVSLNLYKVLKSNDFAYVADTSRRGDKMAIALNNSDKDYIMSSAYTSFRIADTEKLLPQYLFLFLSRPEFDRYSRFNSWGSARETFDWTEMCRIQIPLPSIEVQQAIVDVYECAERAKRIATEARARLKDICPALIQRAANAKSAV